MADAAQALVGRPTRPGELPPLAREATVGTLAALLAGRRTLVLSGAGCSTDSGIPDYRDAGGQWKRHRPMQFQEFVSSDHGRRRYWARSLVGWRRVAAARPGRAHHALARLEAAGLLAGVVTQNVDGLHQRAGSRGVIDLHGRLDAVECLQCQAVVDRARFQLALEATNPGWADLAAREAPDGDADLDGVDYAHFQVPGCEHCGGVLKPAVVFFGECVPQARVAAATRALHRADVLLVVGSSLMVWSGYRFVRAAAAAGTPVVCVGLGRTRGERELAFRVTGSCGEVLAALVQRLGVSS